MAPREPTAERREHLLAELGDLISRGGAGPLLAAPIAPGDAAFPEPWRATRGGVVALLRRLAWHVGNPRAISVIDERMGAPPTERKPETRVGLQAVDAKTLHFRIEFLGTDDVAGTLAHELGVAHAVVNRPASDPYREAELPQLDVDVDRDHERGSLAAVYLGLGVIAANSAFQEYSRAGRFNGAYEALEHDVLRAGYLPMSELAFLLAVQATVRLGVGDHALGAKDVAPLDAAKPLPPPGLRGPQRDEVAAWIDELYPTRFTLRETLAIPRDALPAKREAPVRFTDIDLDDDAPPPKKTAFRWRTHRGGVGFVAGAALGMGGAYALTMGTATIWIVMGAAAIGHMLGRSVNTPRCSACATVVSKQATTCSQCGAALRGDIKSLSERLEAEERLLETASDEPRS